MRLPPSIANAAASAIRHANFAERVQVRAASVAAARALARRRLPGAAGVRNSAQFLPNFLRDSQRNSLTHLSSQVPFNELHNAIAVLLPDQCAALLLYLLLHGAPFLIRTHTLMRLARLCLVVFVMGF